MRRFNPGYTLAFLLVLLAAYLGWRWTYPRAEAYFQNRMHTFATYTVDDWIAFFHVDEWFGEPDITPVPAGQYPFTITPHPTTTTTPEP